MPDEDFEADETMEDGPAPPAPGGGGGGMMKIIIIVVALLAVGGGAFMFMGGDEEEAAEGEAEEEKTEIASNVKKVEFGFPVSIEDQTVNVRDGKRSRMLVYNATFEAVDEAAAAELTNRTRQLSDLLLREIASFSYEQLTNVTFRDTLEAHLRGKVNGLLMDGTIRRIYFDQWIVN
jgi:flagellar protein FliL